MHSRLKRKRANRPAAEIQVPKPAFPRATLWISLALIAINVVVYAPVRGYDFVTFDDPQYITGNPYIAGGLTWQGVWWALTTGYTSYWHPLTWLSHMLDIQLFGLNAGGHHVVSVLIHIATTLVLFGVLHRMTGARGRSAFVAALFAVHPLHVESVAWVAERKDVLSGLFWMLTLWAYVSYVHQPAPLPTSHSPLPAPRLSRYLITLLLFALGLMAKPMLVTLPFVLLLLDFWPLRRTPLPLLREKLPFFALAAASSIVTFLVQRNVGAVAELQTLPLQSRVANALVSYVAYIGDMLWPTRLAALYPYLPLPVWKVAGASVALIAISILVFRAARRYPYLPVGWLWYLGTLVPVIGLIQVGGQSRADRFTYIPLIGLFIIVAWGIPELFARWQYRNIALPAAAGLVLLACAITARNQAAYWGNSVTLWEHTLEIAPLNYLAHNNLGVMLRDQGRPAEAIAHFTESLRIRPNSAEAHNNLGAALAEGARVDEAIPQYIEALRLRPEFADAHNNLGVALAEQGKTGEAIREFQESLRINPDQANTQSNLAVMLQNQGRTVEAVQHFEAALKLNPAHLEARRSLEKLRGGVRSR